MYDLDREIAGLPFMLELDDYLRSRAVSAIRATAARAHLPAGTLLFTTSDTTCNDGYVLVAGNVSIETTEGRTKTVVPTAILGEMGQFDFDPMHQRAATVHAEEALEVLHFAWSRLYENMATTCAPDEIQEFRTALRRYAWLHYMDNQGEL